MRVRISMLQWACLGMALPRNRVLLLGPLEGLGIVVPKPTLSMIFERSLHNNCHIAIRIHIEYKRNASTKLSAPWSLRCSGIMISSYGTGHIQASYSHAIGAFHAILQTARAAYRVGFTKASNGPASSPATPASVNGHPPRSFLLKASGLCSSLAAASPFASV